MFCFIINSDYTIDIDNDFSNIIQGSFNQGNTMFGKSVGKQCSCCSLYSIAFSIVKSPGYWNTCDLDFIVSNGDRLYKSLNKDTYLSIPDLPKSFLMFEKSLPIKVDYLDCDEFGFVSYSKGSFHSFDSTFSKGDGCIFIIS